MILDCSWYIFLLLHCKGCQMGVQNVVRLSSCTRSGLHNCNTTNKTIILSDFGISPPFQDNGFVETTCPTGSPNKKMVLSSHQRWYNIFVLGPSQIGKPCLWHTAMALPLFQCPASVTLRAFRVIMVNWLWPTGFGGIFTTFPTKYNECDLTAIELWHLNCSCWSHLHKSEHRHHTQQPSHLQQAAGC